jgi:hypothetical protein
MKHYEQEIKALNVLSNENTNAQIGIITRKRALDIIKKDLVYAESEHERIHHLWEEVDVCLTKIAGIQVPDGLELNLSDETEAEVQLKSNTNTPETSRSYSTMSYTMSWGRNLINKLKRQKMSTSASTLTSYPSNISHCSSEKRHERDNKLDLTEEEWFHGSLPRSESNKLLLNKGDFLVRQTLQNDKQCIVVSVLWNGFRHFIVNTDSQVNYFLT